MTDEKRKHRGWVKNAAIIFLAVMLIFTLFSNTIMNRSLPEVAAVPTQRSTITMRVRGQGSVSANESYELTMKETREISSVPVKIGQTVEIGDILIKLADKDSEEIKTAQNELDALRLQYEKALITASGKSYESQNATINRAREDLNKLLEQKAKGDVSNEEIQAAKDKVAGLKDEVNDYSEQVAYYEHMAIQAENAGTPSFGFIALRDAAKIKLNDAQKALTEAEEKLKDLEDRQGGFSDLDAQILAAQRGLEDLILSLNETMIADGKAQALEAIDLRELQNSIDDKVEEIAELRANATGGDIASKVRGTVKQINVSAGNTAAADTVLMLIDVIDRGHTVSFSVTNDQASKVKVGDMGEVSNYYMWGTQIQAILESIKTDPGNPSQKKLLTFAIHGEVNSGDQLTITVGQRSSEYDVVVPNSAIREDTNGTFVFQLTTKSSPLGNRFVATRVPVTILAQDDMNCAIESSLSSWGSDFVITTSSMPLEHGMMVKQVDNA